MQWKDHTDLGFEINIQSGIRNKGQQSLSCFTRACLERAKDCLLTVTGEHYVMKSRGTGFPNSLENMKQCIHACTPTHTHFFILFPGYTIILEIPDLFMALYILIYRLTTYSELFQKTWNVYVFRANILWNDGARKHPGKRETVRKATF